eukprot:SAG11_NODE_20197_length_450_cov_2.994302_1_plen_53_part_01
MPATMAEEMRDLGSISPDFVYYRVKWKNYAEVGREATWQPREDLEKNASEILE